MRQQVAFINDRRINQLHLWLRCVSIDCDCSREAYQEVTITDKRERERERCIKIQEVENIAERRIKQLRL